MSPESKRQFTVLPAAFLLFAGTCLAETPQLGIKNEKHPLPGVTSAGQPTGEQLTAAKAAGYKTVVDLRPETESPERNEAAAVAKLGMEYVNIPVEGPADLTEENARKLMALLNDESKKPILVHCGISERVGALIAVGSAKVEGKSPEEALALGQQAGLNQLTPAVRRILGLPPA